MTAAFRSDVFARQPGHNQIARVMRKFGCNAVTRRKNTYKVCVKRGVLPDGTVLKNRLNRQFNQDNMGKTFVTDVTYIPVKEGWLYVSPVMDLCSHEIVVCEMSLHQDMALGLKTLESLRKVINGQCFIVIKGLCTPAPSSVLTHQNVALNKAIPEKEIAGTMRCGELEWDSQNGMGVPSIASL